MPDEDEYDLSWGELHDEIDHETREQEDEERFQRWATDNL